MPSPFRADQLSPQMQARYGLNRRSRAPWVVGLLTLAVLAFVGWLTVAGQGSRVDSALLRWDASAADHTTVIFEVRRAQGQAVTCAIRGQDRTRVDVGYALVDIPAGEPSVQVDYELGTLMPSFVVEVLGCAPQGELRVPGPQFPPGVVPPEQPWQG